MEITIRARDGHVPERLREFATQKLLHLGRFLSTISSVDVELYEDGSPKATGSHVAEITIATSGPIFRSRGSASDPRTSIDLAVERAERRLKEFKRRRSGRPAHSRPRVHAPTISAEAASDMSLSDATAALQADTSVGIREGTRRGGGDRAGAEGSE